MGIIRPVSLSIVHLGDMATDRTICEDDIIEPFLKIEERHIVRVTLCHTIYRRNLKGKSVEGYIKL